MNKKDIALTVGGVIATMILAWLLYRLQKKDSAAAAAAAAAAEDAQQQNTDEVYSLLSSSPSFGGGYVDTSSAGSTASVDTSAQLNTNGNPDEDSAAGDSILTNLLGDLTTSLAGTSESSLIIPTLNTTGNNALNSANLPTTAAQEFGGVLPGNIGSNSPTLANGANSGNENTTAEGSGILNPYGSSSVSTSGRNGLPTNIAAINEVS